MPFVCRGLVGPQRVRSPISARRGARGLAAIAHEHEQLRLGGRTAACALQPSRSSGAEAGPGVRSPDHVRFLRPARRGQGREHPARRFAGGSAARLVVGGRGPLEQEVRSAGPGVFSAGWVSMDRKEALFDDLDCLVVPSEWKDGSVVVNEARGAASRSSERRSDGIPELIASQCRPLPFPPGDAVTFAQRLEAFAMRRTGTSAPPGPDRLATPHRPSACGLSPMRGCRPASSRPRRRTRRLPPTWPDGCSGP
jgi:hypothetical protein